MINPLFEAIVLNMYLPNPSTQKKFLQGIEGKIIQAMACKPSTIWIIAGDFNQKTQPFPHLINISNNFHSFERTKDGKLIQSKLDWIFSNQTKTTCHQIWHKEVSDHSLFIATITFTPQGP
jgi:endonuclease/exonuclease/phosphatase family metal-dependent hydrolase